MSGIAAADGAGAGCQAGIWLAGILPKRPLWKSAMAWRISSREFMTKGLLVQDAGGGGHPLHVAGADQAAFAGRVAMLDLALIDDRDGLEAAMRMNADAAGALSRSERGRPA
jgi:hypothetical protein